MEGLLKHATSGELQAFQGELQEVAVPLKPLILVGVHDVLEVHAYDPNFVEEGWITMEVDLHMVVLRNRVDVRQVGFLCSSGFQSREVDLRYSSWEAYLSHRAGLGPAEFLTELQID